MFSKKEKYLIRDNKWRSVHIKYMYKNLIKKSLKKVGYIGSAKKIYFKLHTLKSLSAKKKNICLLSGENTSINKKFLLSRFQLNYLGVKNQLQNFKLSSW